MAPDDPLKSVPAGELLRSRREEFDQAARKRGIRGFRRIPQDEDIPLRGLAGAIHFGVAGLLLLLAAILLSQLFARKALAFAGTLAGVVFFTAILDRAALGSHLSRLKDAEQTEGTRLAACLHATDTFFYRQTAIESIRAAGLEGAGPKPLRKLARDVELDLDRSDVGRWIGYFARFPAQTWGHTPKLADLALDDLAPELERHFPIRLSKTALGQGDSGLWVACWGIDADDPSIPVLQQVAFVSWRDGRITRAVQIPELVAAFAHGGFVYFHWWEDPASGWGMYVSCNSSGWSQTSEFSFARVRRGDVDESKLKLRPLEEYRKLIDRPDDDRHDGVALYDVLVLTGERKGRFQSVIEFR